MGNPTYYTTEKSFNMRILDVTKSQGIGKQNWACTHRENISNNPTHPSGRPFERFNRTRVIMGFNLESNAPSVSNIDDSSIFFTCFNEDLTDRLLVFLLGGE
jgi:hypothetical protein